MRSVYLFGGESYHPSYTYQNDVAVLWRPQGKHGDDQDRRQKEGVLSYYLDLLLPYLTGVGLVLGVACWKWRTRYRGTGRSQAHRGNVLKGPSVTT